MDDKSMQTTTERLKLSLIKRIVVLLFGCIAATIILNVLPLLYFTPISAEASTRTRPAADTAPVGAFVVPAVTLLLVGLLAYGIYDAIRMFLRYRKSQQDEQQMFL
jgi:hypothetical protein